MNKDPLMEHLRYMFRNRPKPLKPKRDTWYLFTKKSEIEQLKYLDSIKHNNK